MEAQQDTRDNGVYLILYKDDDGTLRYSELETKKSVTLFLEELGTDKLSGVKLFKGAKPVEVKTKVMFTF